jgi:hypothetical protein
VYRDNTRTLASRLSSKHCGPGNAGAAQLHLFHDRSSESVARRSPYLLHPVRYQVVVSFGIQTTESAAVVGGSHSSEPAGTLLRSIDACRPLVDTRPNVGHPIASFQHTSPCLYDWGRCCRSSGRSARTYVTFTMQLTSPYSRSHLVSLSEPSVVDPLGSKPLLAVFWTRQSNT